MENTFGQLMKDLRRSRSISQRDLAIQVGVDFTYISKIENDRLPPPSAQTIEKIKGRINPDLKIIGILPTMYDPRTVHGREVLERVEEAFGDKVFETVIARTVKFPETTAAGSPITEYAPNSSASKAYKRLAREVIAKLS